nr:hypothetical protein Iba_scaffold446CG0190 [Ipomoea batatas]GME17452.1 hypothetical protein Iba_scaffold18831CG0030 [Ipomoea batatas]
MRLSFPTPTPESPQRMKTQVGNARPISTLKTSCLIRGIVFFWKMAAPTPSMSLKLVLKDTDRRRRPCEAVAHTLHT